MNAKTLCDTCFARTSFGCTFGHSTKNVRTCKDYVGGANKIHD
jgi:hypothetical protein